MIDDLDNNYERNDSTTLSKDDFMWRAFSFLGILILGLLIGWALTGCAAHTPSPLVNGVSVQHNPVAPVVNHLVATSHPFIASIIQSLPSVIRSTTSAPPDLKPVSEWTNVLVILGILVAAAATGLYFFESALHQVAIGAGVAGLALAAYSLFVHTTLWIAPYVSGFLLLFAVAVGIYEVVRYLIKQAQATTTSGTTVAPVAKHPFPDLATKVVTLTPNPVKTVPVAVTLPALGVLGTIEADIKKVEGTL